MLNTANYQRNANQNYTSHESEWPSPKTVQTSAGEEIKKREASYTAGGLYVGAATMENSMSVCMLSCFSQA